MTLEFKKLDEYIAQHKEVAEKQGQLSRAAASTLEAHQAAKAEYETTMRRGLMEGVDVSAELDRLDEKVTETLKQYERKKRESETFSTLDKSYAISQDDVLNAWNGEFLTEYKRSKLDQVLANMVEAKARYVSAVRDYFECVGEIDDIRSDVLSALGDYYYYKLDHIKFGNTVEKSKYLLTDELLYKVHSGDFDHTEIKQLLKSTGGEQ
ncbi:HlyD family secretion protein [Paenibacillus dendritiformis]|uniref:hypothetical protein n=1 Tax=Paenibacillus dendritiformis TaxID=130049 RepID=UPI00387E0474